jgi:cold shock CspA family protein
VIFKKIFFLFMAKSKETHNKKEREKKKQKQLQDKKHRMEERKANKKTGSWEDMIMYTDENGNLQSQPPDPRLKKVINAEDMQIGVPKREDIVETPKTGVVSFFNTEKGFGFINTVPDNERIFFHINNILQPLQESDKVQFMIEPGPRGPMAVEVTKL